MGKDFDKFCIILASMLLLSTPVMADEAAEKTAVRTNAAYLMRLKRLPRPGAAFDKIYSFHIDRGTVDEFLTELSATDTVDDASTLIAGFVHQRRGNFEAAQSSFEIAIQRRAADPIPAWHLGQVFLSIGKNKKAAEALESALQLATARRDQSEIFQLLGRVYQRSQQPDKALKLWQRYEDAFPGDVLVQEQIAAALVEEARYPEALDRYRKLAETAKDLYKKTEHGITVAELHLKLQETNKAIAEFEKQLQQLRPGSWQREGIRNRIERAVLKTDDEDGLAEYYDKWLQQYPDDLDAMSRLANHFSSTQQHPAALKWYQQAIAKAPSDVKLREALIGELSATKQFDEALQQCEQLVEMDAGNAVHLERWGRILLRNNLLPEGNRKTQAAEVWRRLLQLHPDDAQHVSHVADLFRGAGMVDEAVALYRKAIQLSPEQPQFAEYLGEYFHSLRRRDDAIATFRSIAAGDLQTTPNLTRLSQLLSDFGYATEAAEAMREAVGLTPEFADHIQFAKMLKSQTRFDDALQQLNLADAIAADDAERRQIRDERIQTLATAGRLQETIEDLQQQLTATASDGQTERQWQSLGLMQEATGNLRGAAESLQQAVQRNPESLASWAIAARVMEKAGLLADASAAHRRISTMDRRTRVDHLKRVAELEQQLGRSERSMQAAKDVVAAAPGNPQVHRFFADMCFRLGQPEQAVESLRQSVRANPGDRESLVALADVLANDFQTQEAIEFYWRAFEKTDDLNARVSMVRSLSNLYLRLDRFTQLTSRLKSLAATTENRRDILHCLVNAYQSAGDSQAARTTVEDLLQDNLNDVALLREAVALAQDTNDLAAAIRYQRRLIEQSSSSEDTSKLGQLLVKSGNEVAAAAVWTQLAFDSTDQDSVLTAMDEMIARGMSKRAAEIADLMLTRNASNWQAILRLAVIHWKQDQFDESILYCGRLLALAPHEANNGSGIDAPPSEFSRLTIQRENVRIEMDISDDAGGTPNPLRWRDIGASMAAVVTDKAKADSNILRASKHFNAARCVALTLQRLHHERNGTSPQFLDALFLRAQNSEEHATEAAWDCFYAVPKLGSKDDRRLLDLLQPIQTPDAQLTWLYLQLRSSPERPDSANTKDLMAAYHAIAIQSPDWLQQYDIIPLLLQKLNAAGANSEAEQLILSLHRPEASDVEIDAAWELAISDQNISRVLNLAERLIDNGTDHSANKSRQDKLDSLGWTFGALASAKIAAGEWEAVEELLTGFLNAKAAMLNRGRVGQSENPNIYDFVVTSSHRTFTAGRQSNSIRVNTLPPDGRLSLADINFLVNLELLAGEEHWPQILSVVENFHAQSTGDSAITAELVLAQLKLLHGDQNAAAVHVTRAAALVPSDAGLRLRLAQFIDQSGNAAEALALLDTINAVDQTVIKQRETMALQLASATGNPVRARQAAERLFGLRLDTDASIKLAGQLRTLELNDLAEALLRRIQRSPGNGVQTLESLMEQYHEQGDADMTAQIAQQILQETNTGSRRSAAAEAVRASAIQTLAKLERLDSQIERNKRLLDQNPDSINLLQTLAEFYKAAGQSKDAVAMAARLAEIQPNSIDHLLRLATQYEKVRNFAAATDQYIEILKKDPQRFTQNYYQYLRTFSNARRLPDLADVLLTVDLRKLNNNYYVVGETIEELFKAAATDRNNRDSNPNQTKGLELLAAAWKAFPNDRSYLLNNIRDPEIWNLPVMFEYAREGLIPATPQQAIARPWRGIAESPSFGFNGEVSGTLTRVLRAMPNEAKLQEFTTEIESAVSKFPNWHGGKLILSVVKAQRNDDKAAIQLLRQIQEDASIRCVPTQAAWLVGAELEKQGQQFLPAATQMLRQSLNVEGIQVSNGYEQSAGQRLALLLSKNRQPTAAREIILQTIAAADKLAYKEPGRRQWQQLADLNASARDLAAIGMPLDAIGICRRVTLKMLVASEQYKNEGKAHRKYRETKQLDTQLKRLLSTKVLVEYLSRNQRIADTQDLRAPVLNLLLTAPRLNTDFSVDNSVILEGLQYAATQQSAEITQTLSKLLAQHSDDVSVAVSAFVYAEARSDETLRQKAILNLRDSNPPPRSSDVALWFVARSVLRESQSNELGMTLADRAEAAARTQKGSQWLQAILRERGEIAIKSGDQAAAEQIWTRLLDVVVPETVSTETNARATSRQPSAVRELRERLLKTAPPKTP